MSNLFWIEKLIKLVSRRTWKGGPSRVLYWKNNEEGTCGLAQGKETTIISKTHETIEKFFPTYMCLTFPSSSFFFFSSAFSWFFLLPRHERTEERHTHTHKQLEVSVQGVLKAYILASLAEIIRFMAANFFVFFIFPWKNMTVFQAHLTKIRTPNRAQEFE